jgi:hypothetical protein
MVRMGEFVVAVIFIQIRGSEVGPQKIKLSDGTIRRVREMSGWWSAFSKSIHPYFVIEFSIVFS